MVLYQAIELDRPVHSSVADNDSFVEVCLAECFRSNGLFKSGEVCCDHCEGVVVLRGRVHSFHQKQMAQELARKVDGVKIVVNRLLVDRSKFAREVTEAVPFKLKTALQSPS